MLNKRKYIVWLLFIATVLAIVSWAVSNSNVKTTVELVADAEKVLHRKELLAKDRLRLLTKFLKKTPPKKLFSLYEGSITDLYKREGIVILAYQNDSLCFWSDNHAAVDLNAYTNERDIQIIKLRNGWFEFIRQKDSMNPHYSGAALIAIKEEYDIENKYLLNRFERWLGLPENTDIKEPINYLPHAVRSYTGMPLFEVVNKNGVYRSKQVELAAFLCAITAVILFFIALIVFFRHYYMNQALAMLLLTGFVFMLRAAMIWLHWPKVFYNTLLFDPSKFADANSFFYSSLGDILINSMVIFVLAVLVYRYFDTNNISKRLRYFTTLAGGVLIFYFSFKIMVLIRSLVVNSTISYNINELFDLSWYSIVAFISVCLLLFSFYVCVEKLIVLLIHEIASIRLILLIFFFSVIYIFLLHGMGYAYPETIWPFLFIAISFLLRKYKASYNFINVGLLIVVAAITTSYLFTRNEKRNTLDKYEAISYKLSDKQDIIAENEFEKISRNIKTDNKLKNLLNLLPLSAEHTEQRIRQINFSGYFDRYDVVISLFDEQCHPYFKSIRPEYMNEDYFQAQIDSGGIQTVSDDLFFIEENSPKVRYIAKIDIDDPGNPEKRYRLYAQFEPKQVSDLGSFPDLLIDRSLQNQLNLGNISYALYNKGRLISKYGDYNYTLFENKAYTDNQDPEVTHHVFKNEPATTVVITDKRNTAWYRFTSVSYFFVFFSTIVLLVIFLNTIIVNRRVFIRSLNTRIQFILVIIVVFSLAGVVIGTVSVVASQSEEKNKKELLAKSQNVVNELQQSIGLQDKLELNYRDYTSFVLKKLANLFGSDISVYDKEGRLFSTSRPIIYEQGMVSRFMNPMAFSAFIQEQPASYSLKENIGELNYLSAYVPFYNTNDQLIGYINLPYFSRQKDLEKELTAYLTTLINIYTILFACTTLIALVVSNYLTKPLRLIQQQLSNIGLGKYNDRLDWNTNDEIGDLVKEYNNMLAKLEASSELLARSERESAWREMAKQVAHEIKNPLTPMKLNIQHLQRVIELHPEDVNERVNKVANLLIEQIDTLTHIANEFSNFAKLPRATIEDINLCEVLRNVVELFRQDNQSDIELDAHEELFVLADREQLIRVFTNLLRNAEQSIPPGRKGRIRVHSITDGDNALISIHDNGTGIEEQHRAKIFTPNFTTKSAGTGLGLAMVKNIITSFNGTIWFETEVDKGTTFFIRLPIAKNVA
ncbi:MAG: HAMP domain-containing protein [Bacteroidetes bacterium]|nr:HAMP domain-containing protein [Bacteroidota bacterium]